MKLPEEIQFIANARMPQKSTDVLLDGKLCIITGATSGVGYAAARELAKGNANLVLVNRNSEKAENVRKELLPLGKGEIELINADFSRLSDVRSAATKILAQYPRIYVLINNAGVHRTQRMLTEEGFELAFCINHLASFLFTRLLLERILESAPARILQINSQGHRFGGLDLDDLNWERRRYRGLQGYGASKVAQLLTVWELADQLEGSGVSVNAMHPGAVRTSIGMDNGFIHRWYQKLIVWPMLKRAEISGQAIYYLVADPEMQQVSGKFFNQTIEEKPASHALDRELGKRVWRISEEMTGLG